MRISTTTLESYRLFMQPDQDWMTEEDLRESILGVWKPNHKAELGTAFGQVLEDPDKFLVPGGFRSGLFEFGRDVVEPCLELIDRRGVFEAKATKRYGDCDVVAKADHLYGAHLSEFKTTLSTFDFQKYAESCQWRFMVDIFEPKLVTYHVFCLAEATNGVISLRSIESFNLFPYAGLHAECCAMVEEFRAYVIARGLDAHLRQRQVEAA
jgi:hypothetical protein